MKVRTTSLSLIFFTAIVSFFEYLGAIAASIQMKLLPFSVGLAGASTLAQKFLNALGVEFINDIFQATTAAAIIPYFAHFFISLIVLAIFLSIDLASPKGTYTISNRIIVFCVFFLESLPIIGGLTLWVFFIWYLRAHQVKKVGLSALSK